MTKMRGVLVRFYPRKVMIKSHSSLWSLLTTWTRTSVSCWTRMSTLHILRAEIKGSATKSLKYLSVKTWFRYRLGVLTTFFLKSLHSGALSLITMFEESYGREFVKYGFVMVVIHDYVCEVPSRCWKETVHSSRLTAQFTCIISYVKRQLYSVAWGG